MDSLKNRRDSGKPKYRFLKYMKQRVRFGLLYTWRKSYPHMASRCIKATTCFSRVRFCWSGRPPPKRRYTGDHFASDICLGGVAWPY